MGEQKQDITAQIDTLNALEKFGSLSNSQFSNRVELRATLKQLILDNARKWLLRFKPQHLKASDANTSYFHCLTNGRRRRNTIQKLVINGVDNFSQADISDEISRYFYQLVQDKHTLRPQLNEELFTKISEDDSRSLVFN